MSKSILADSIDEKILTGGRRTSALNERILFKQMVNESFNMNDISADALTGAELFPLIQGGVSKNVTLATLASFIGGGGGGSQSFADVMAVSNVYSGSWLSVDGNSEIDVVGGAVQVKWSAGTLYSSSLYQSDVALMQYGNTSTGYALLKLSDSHSQLLLQDVGGNTIGDFSITPDNLEAVYSDLSTYENKMYFDSGGIFLRYSDLADKQSKLVVSSAQTQLRWTDGTETADILSNVSAIKFSHTTALIFDSPVYNFPTLTASSGLALDASSNLVTYTLPPIFSPVDPTNLAYGYGAFASLITGALYNIAIGTAALNSLQNGINNIAIGDTSGQSLIDGNSNIFIGDDTYADSSSISFSIALGPGVHLTDSNQFVVGSGGAPILNAYFGQGVAHPSAKLWAGELNLGTATPDTFAYFDSSGNLVSAAAPSSDLASVLAIGNSTGNQDILSPDTYSYLWVKDTAFQMGRNNLSGTNSVIGGTNSQVTMGYTNSSGGPVYQGYVLINDTNTAITHSEEVNITTPIINLIGRVYLNADATDPLEAVTYQQMTGAGYLTTISGIAAGGELSGTYANPAVLNSAVIGKVLTGLNVTGSSISSTDTVLAAFGKLQNQINGVLGGAIYQGVYNATTNTPTLIDGTGTKGNYYVVNVAGVHNFGSGNIDLNVGDWIIYNGTIWQKVDNTDAVSSVNGFIGAVSLTTANISEVTNLYYTNARVLAAPLTGYVSGAGTVSATDTVLQAFQKITGNISALPTGSGTTNRLTYWSASGTLAATAITYTGATLIYSAFVGFSINNGTGIAIYGDFNTVGNGTILTIDDGNNKISVTGDFSVSNNITSGNWQGTIISPMKGGTGKANANSSTWTISGAFGTTVTVTATTAITLPTSGTLYGTATGSFSSAQLLNSLSTSTGTGNAVFATSPTLVTPTIGVATATSVNNVAFTQPVSLATLTLATGITLIVSGGGTIALGGFTLTVPNTGTATLGSPGASGRVFVGTAADTGAGSTALTYASNNLVNTVSANGIISLQAINANTGGATQAQVIASNNTVATIISVLGTAFTTAGLNVAGLSKFTSTSAAGILFQNTTASTKFWWTIGGSATTDEAMRLLTGGKLSIGTQADPTAVLHLKAGTATANTSPLKFTSGVNLTTKENGSVEYDGANIYFTTGSTRFRLAGTGTPGIAAGAGAGTTPTISVAGNDANMVVSLTTGTLPTGAAVVFTITYNKAFDSVPIVVFSPANNNAAALSGLTMVFMDANASSTTFICTVGATGLTAATAYKWNIRVEQ